jgi:hypothetical protein
MELVDLVVKVPAGTESVVLERVMDVVKSCIVEQKRGELNAIQAEIDSSFDFVKGANGLAPPKKVSPA